MCIVCITNNKNRNVYMYLKIRIFPTSGYARVLLFMFIRRELGGTGTGCLFQFTYCEEMRSVEEREGDRIIDIDLCFTGNDGHPKTLLSSSQHTQTFTKWS